MAAQNAINEYNFSVLSAELISVFGYTNHNNPLNIDDIDNIFGSNPESKQKLIMLFRHYEALARGVNQGIYEEES